MIVPFRLVYLEKQSTAQESNTVLILFFRNKCLVSSDFESNQDEWQDMMLPFKFYT